MLNGLGVDGGPGARGAPQGAKEAKIGVTKMTFTAESKAPAPNTQEAATAKQTSEMKQAAEVLTKQIILDAKDALAKNGKEARVALKLVSGNEAIVNNLWGQRDAEYFEASKIKDPKEQQQKYAEIQKRYEKLMQYAENRQNETRLNISRLKKSENPKDQALAIDLENANAEIDIQSYDMTIRGIQQILKSGINPRTGLQLEKSEIDHYSSKLSRISIRKDELDQITKKSKEARKEMKDADGQPIRNVISDMVTVLSGQEQENPIAFLEQRVTQAFISKDGMENLTNDLVTAGIVNGADKEAFIKDMELGLTREDIVKMTKNIAGKTALSFAGLLTMLGYAAFQRRKQEITSS